LRLLGPAGGSWPTSGQAQLAREIRYTRREPG
jgi:hypothetical protein